MRPVQFFSPDYLARCKALRPEEILQFLEDFRLLQERPARLRLISLKVPQALLDAFRHRCRLEAVPYQTQIKSLMRRWLEIAEGEGSRTGPVRSRTARPGRTRRRSDPE